MFKEGQELHFQGFPICPGIAIARPFFFATAEDKVPEFDVPEAEIEGEIDRYYKALKHSRNDLISLQERMRTEGGNEAVAILSSHLEMMHDPIMTEKVAEKIRTQGKNTEFAFKIVIGEYEKKFNKITDQFFQDRVKDFQDISRRVIGHLRKNEKRSLGMIDAKVIVFAHELMPSDTAEAKTESIDAFVTRSGALTSHVAIMARARGIPFVSNVDFPDFSVSLPPIVIVDGGRGNVVINPSKATLQHYKQERKKLKIFVKGLQEESNVLEAVTIDGHGVRLSANIEMFNELDTLSQYGGEGVGLFRTEYLFLAGEAFPAEEEQFIVYKSIVEKLSGQPAVIRTFDIGGDKFGDFHPSRYEKNPYLGCRAIRLMLKEKTAFKTQIRAILRASAFGDVKLLFPMISGLSELREAKSLVQEAKKELLAKKIPFDRALQIGCMIEVPSAAVTCDILARECDFLSIGTNDLVQYALAVDRGNPAMSYLYRPAHPSILRLVKMVTAEGKRSGKSVSVCGEIAADPKFTQLLLGLGVNELSLSSPSLPVIKNMIRKSKMEDAIVFANHILTLATVEEIESVLEENYEKYKE